jgi:hypothetical protein
VVSGQIIFPWCINGLHCKGPTEYCKPYEDLVPQLDPSIEDMKRVVVDEKKRPTIPDAWAHIKVSYIIYSRGNCTCLHATNNNNNCNHKLFTAL